MPRLDRKNQTGVAIGGTSRLFTRAIPLGTSLWQTAFVIESLLESVDDCGSILTHVHGYSASLSIAEMTVKVLVKISRDGRSALYPRTAYLRAALHLTGPGNSKGTRGEHGFCRVKATHLRYMGLSKMLALGRYPSLSVRNSCVIVA